jgi:hypothetical protein
MGLFDWFSDATDSLLGGDGGGLGTGLVDVALGAGDYIDNEWSAPAAASPVRMINSPSGLSAGGMLAPIGGMVARGLSRFPALAGAIAGWRGKGVSLTTSKLSAMLRKFGPQFLITAGILTASAVTDLMMYNATHKRRRMNSLNPRALSRATRRLCSFENRASKVHRVLSGLSKRKFKAAC